MTDSQNILLVDDNRDDIELMLDAFEAAGLYDTGLVVRTAGSGDEGLAVLAEPDQRFAVIFSDMSMPGMDGVHFLRRAAEDQPDAVRIMLTGHTDQATAIQAVNEGNIFRFLTKPWDADTLVATVLAGLHQHHLITAEKQLLSETLSGAVRVLTDVLALVNPVAWGRASRVRRLARTLAIAVNAENLWQIELAAMLSHIGCVALPPDTLERALRGEPLSPFEIEMYQGHSRIGAELISKIPRMEEIAALIAAQDPRPTAAPSDVRPLPPLRGPSGRRPSEEVGRIGGPSEDIPASPSAGTATSTGAVPGGLKHSPAARIIAVALEYDRLTFNGMAPRDALAELRLNRHRYEPASLAALEALHRRPPAHIEVTLSELAPGMVLAQPLVDRDRNLLADAGQEVTPALLARLNNMTARLSPRTPLRVTLPAHDSPAANALSS